MATAATNETMVVQADEAAPSTLRPYRISAALYHRIVEAGVFGDGSAVFLWKGQLVEKAPEMSKGRRHVYAVNQLGRLLAARVPEGWFVEQDQPMEIGTDSVPEPDLKVVRGGAEQYISRTPTSVDVPLVIEVADTSLVADSVEMLRAYAGSSVPIYWLVNLPQRRIEVYRRPESGQYAEREVFGPDDDVPVVLDGREVGRIAARDVLP